MTPLPAASTYRLREKCPLSRVNVLWHHHMATRSLCRPLFLTSIKWKGNTTWYQYSFTWDDLDGLDGPIVRPPCGSCEWAPSQGSSSAECLKKVFVSSAAKAGTARHVPRLTGT